MVLNPNTSTNLSCLNILIVEDDPLMQLGLKQFLAENSQLEVIQQETDGYLGIESALALRPDVVLMDIGLPQIDGIEATRQIKAAAPEIRVIILTIHDTEVELVAAMASGADAYCVKGSSINGLVAAIFAVQEGGIYLDPQIARQAIDFFKAPQPVKIDSPLSQRELEILKLIVDGRSNPEIAETLYISLSTVRTHIRAIMNKLMVNDRVQAAVVALRSDLV